MNQFSKSVIKYLLEGFSQPEIAKILKEKGIKPNSLSSIEKEIKRLKTENEAKTSFHLGAIIALKDIPK